MRSSFAFALALLLASASVRAAPITFNPSADTFVDLNHPDLNYGLAGALGLSARGSANGEFDTFMQFTVSLPAGTVQSVTLQLNEANPKNPLFNANVGGSFTIEWISDDSWREGTGSPSAPDANASDLNFTNHNSYLGGAVESLGTFSFDGSTSGPPLNLALTPGFLADLESGGKVSLYLTAADGSVSYLFNSKDFMTSTAEPLLTVTMAPEPGAAALGWLGAIALLGGHRWRR